MPTLSILARGAASRQPAGRPVFFLPVLALGWALLSGCAINPQLDLASVAPAGAEAVHAPAPFFPQEDYQCGPAALAGVLNASGVDITPDQLTPQVYLPERQGSLQVELKAAARRAGRLAYELAPEPEALAAELAAGRPVLVLQNLGVRTYPRWHYAVLTGMDIERNRVVLNSGPKEGKTQRANAFLRTWDWGGRWAIVALRPGELPARGDPLRYAQAVAAYHAVGSDEEVRRAWQAALDEWPRDYRAYLALGNLAYTAGDIERAMALYDQGLRADPMAKVLENNLATALAERGCPRAAERRLAAVLDELGTDSPWRQDMELTLAELRAHPGQDQALCARWH